MEHELNDIDRLTIELLGKRNNYPNTTDSVMSQEVIDEHLSDIIDIFSNLLKGTYEKYNDIKSSFDEFLYKTIKHIIDNKDTNTINMDIESIHEEDTELDITKTNRLLYANMGSGDKKVMNVIRKNDFSS